MLSIIQNKKGRVLTAEDREQFLEKGYIIIREAFDPNTAQRLADCVWELLPEDRNDRSTWTRSGAELQFLVEKGPVAEIFTTRYTEAVDDLLGAGRWHTNRESFGWIPVRFPGFSKPPWEPPAHGWHVDGMNFQHRINPKETALAGMEFFSDIKPGGGGTALKTGSHKYIGALLKQREPEGIPYKELFDIANDNSGNFIVEEATGRAGDVLWMHPFLIHARSPNTGQDVRIAANRTISLHDPTEPLRNEHETSLLEWSIRQMLN